MIEQVKPQVIHREDPSVVCDYPHMGTKWHQWNKYICVKHVNFWWIETEVCESLLQTFAEAL